MRVPIILTLALVGAACATNETGVEPASAAGQTSPNQQIAAGEGRERVRCERMRTTGSRLPAQRICRTEAEWEAYRRNAQELMREIERATVPIMDDPG